MTAHYGEDGVTRLALDPALQQHLERLAVGHPGGLPGYIRDALMGHVALAAAARSGGPVAADLLRAVQGLRDSLQTGSSSGAALSADLERALDTAEELGIGPVGMEG